MAQLWCAGHEDSIRMGCLDGAGRRLLTVAFDKTARIWDIRSGRCLAVLQHQQQLIRGSMAPHGHTVVTVTSDHIAHLWDVRSGQLLHSFEVRLLPSSCAPQLSQHPWIAHTITLWAQQTYAVTASHVKCHFCFLTVGAQASACTGSSKLMCTHLLHQLRLQLFA